MNASLSPRAFSQALMPVWDSLRKLQITALGQKWPGHDGRRLSCRQFLKLVELDVPASFSFHDPAPTSTRDGVYKLLPLSIVSLRIEFEPDMGFLRDRAMVKRDMEVESLHFAERVTYFWLEEILVCTSSTFCDLRRVDVCERRDCRKVHTITDWKTPHHLEHLCLHLGIVLHASIRMRQPPRTHHQPPRIHPWCGTR